MFSNAIVFLAVSSLVAVNAQSTPASAPLPTSTASIPPCVLNCTSTAASQAGCQSVADLSCVCTSTAFQDAARTCLTAQCSTDDQVAANALQSTLCAGISGGGTGTDSSAPASGTETGTGTDTQTGTETGAATDTATGTGAANATTSGAGTTPTTPSIPTSAGSTAPATTPTTPSSNASTTTSTTPSPSGAAAVVRPFELGVAHAVGVVLAMIAGASTLL